MYTNWKDQVNMESMVGTRPYTASGENPSKNINSVQVVTIKVITVTLGKRSLKMQAVIMLTTTGYIKWMVVTVPTGNMLYAIFKNSKVRPFPRIPNKMVLGNSAPDILTGFFMILPYISKNTAAIVLRPKMITPTDTPLTLKNLVKVAHNPNNTAAKTEDKIPFALFF